MISKIKRIENINPNIISPVPILLLGLMEYFLDLLSNSFNFLIIIPAMSNEIEKENNKISNV